MKKETKLTLGETIAEQLSESLKVTFYTLYLVNFISSPKLMQKLFADKIYTIPTMCPKKEACLS